MFSFIYSEEQFEENQKIIEVLEEFAELEGCEDGECINALIHVARYSDYIEENFKEALAKEINRKYEHFVKHARIVVSQETHTITVKELEWDV